MTTNKKSLSKRDIYTYSFFIDFAVMTGVLFLLMNFNYSVSGPWDALMSFPHRVKIWFIVSGILLGLAVAYKVVSVFVPKAKLSLLMPNFTLGWSASLFICLLALFIETNNIRLMYYVQTLNVINVLFAIYAVWSITNFFFGGELFDRIKSLFGKGK